jgi:hypothetical protein
VAALRGVAGPVEEVRLVAFDEPTHRSWEDALRRADAEG